MCRLVIPGMVEAGRGSIVNVSSRAAERGSRGLSTYTASKGGMNAADPFDHRRLRGPRGALQHRPARLHPQRQLATTAIRRCSNASEDMHLTRLPTARDVAYAALFLASSEAEVISGVTLQVDGGSSSARGLTLG